jgi:hypothetical protein
MKNRIKTLSEFITEKRRRPDVNKKENLYDFIIRVTDDFDDGLEPWFISFRKKRTTTFINPFTEFETPAGYYCYPTTTKQWPDYLLNYLSKWHTGNFELRKWKGEEEFWQAMKLSFPYLPEWENLNIIEMVKVKENYLGEEILNHESSDGVYLKKLYKYVTEKNYKVYSQIIDELFDLLRIVVYHMPSEVHDEYDDYYEKVSELIEDVKAEYPFKRETLDALYEAIEEVWEPNRIWYFVDLFGELGGTESNPKDVARLKTKIFLDLNIKGFVDDLSEDDGGGYIHPNEPTQAVFFTKDVVDEIHSYDFKFNKQNLPSNL